MSEPIHDSETAFRLVHPNLWLNDRGRPMSSVFRGELNASAFLASRLGGHPDERLHIEKFASFGRLALRVGDVRSLTDAATHRSLELDVVEDPEGALPPFEHLRDAHAVFVGTHTALAARALLEFIAVRPECIERPPG